MSYEAFRHFADSWGLVFMGLVWAGLVLWALRPAARKHHDDAARMIFDGSEDDEK